MVPSSVSVKYTVPTMPIDTAAAKESVTHVIAIRVACGSSFVDLIAMNLTKMCGCPK